MWQFIVNGGQRYCPLPFRAAFHSVSCKAVSLLGILLVRQIFWHTVLETTVNIRFVNHMVQFVNWDISQCHFNAKCRLNRNQRSLLADVRLFYNVPPFKQHFKIYLFTLVIDIIIITVVVLVFVVVVVAVVVRISIIIIDLFSGPSSANGPVYVCRVWTITFDLNNFWSIWHSGSLWHCLN